MLFTGNQFQNERYTKLKVNKWKRIFHCKWKWKKKNPGVTILIPDKTDLTQKLYSKRQRRTLHNNKGSNPTRG